ncbi:MAG: methionine--tRNA ligase [Erysipelotrichaceae bacterium]|jgi:methionyl-tRNA synthetase|nr:methionine--tRNA ligase [Erysipelotrichaceae bacterium]
MKNNTYYITTPIYYPSDNFHIGHCYTTVIADCLSRYHKLKGEDVYFLTGSDEHGQKIAERAAAAGKSPKEFVDPIVANAKDLWKALDIEYDRFIRTTDEDHIRCVQRIYEKLYEQGDIYKGYYEGWYCTPCESYWTQSQLVDGKCPDCGREVKLMKEESYFLRLSKYQKQFEEYLESHRDLMQPESRYNEMVNNFLKPGLQDLSVSRTVDKLSWGIPLTFDSNHVSYVWIDALSNYISAMGYLSEDDSLFQTYWPASLHLVGKEIFRFHTIIWPIMLMALGVAEPLKVYGHGWLIIEGGKISKSLGNYKDPRIYIKDYGVDTVRYFLLSEVPFGNDGQFSELLMVQRRNSDLANVLGNLVNRTLTMSNRYLSGKIKKNDVSGAPDASLQAMINDLSVLLEDKMDGLRVDEAIGVILDLLRRSNKYVDETEPWKLGKDPEAKERLESVLYHLLEAIRVSAIALMPFIPETSKRIFEQLNTSAKSYSDMAYGKVDEYQVTANPEILFERIDEKSIGVSEEPKAAEKPVEESKPEITMDDFSKIQLQVGLVKSCKKHPKADKLLISQVDIGDRTVQIVSGIAEHYTPEEFTGKKIIVITNLKPAVLRGETSEGMLLAGSDGKLLEVVSVQDLAPGTKIY